MLSILALSGLLCLIVSATIKISLLVKYLVKQANNPQPYGEIETDTFTSNF